MWAQERRQRGAHTGWVCGGYLSVGGPVRHERQRPSAQTGNRPRKISCSPQCRGQGQDRTGCPEEQRAELGGAWSHWREEPARELGPSRRLTLSPPAGAISSGFRLEESPFVPYDFISSSASPASPPAPVGDGWPRAKSPSGSSSVNWPPGEMRPAGLLHSAVGCDSARMCVIGLSAQAK